MTIVYLVLLVLAAFAVGVELAKRTVCPWAYAARTIVAAAAFALVLPGRLVRRVRRWMRRHGHGPAGPYVIVDEDYTGGDWESGGE